MNKLKLDYKIANLLESIHHEGYYGKDSAGRNRMVADFRDVISELIKEEFQKAADPNYGK